ncbi:hypothetical protein GJ496_011409 [Pomphorhynchus laevis]|nr:hypothetical protein GJ496_011409 [Pomphorhynchus laevis]
MKSGIFGALFSKQNGKIIATCIRINIECHQCFPNDIDSHDQATIQLSNLATRFLEIIPIKRFSSWSVLFDL